MFDAILEDIRRLRRKGWDCLIETQADGWDVELSAGDECLCLDRPCPHPGALIQEGGEDLAAALRAAVDRALCIKPTWLNAR